MLVKTLGPLDEESFIDCRSFAHVETEKKFKFRKAIHRTFKSERKCNLIKILKKIEFSS